MQKEIWTSIINYEGWYSVSNFGRIRRDKIGQSTHAGRIIKGYPSRKNYITVNLSKKGIQKKYRIHKLVISSFLEICPEGKQVNHKDADKNNNHLSNLEYVTPKENVIHAWKNRICKSFLGSKHGNAKLKEKNIPQIKKLRKGGVSYRKIGEKFNVTYGTIEKIIKNKSWRHIKKG